MSFFEDVEEPTTVKTDTIINSLWVERYRPLKLEDYVGNELIKEKAEIYVETQDIPHLLLSGRAGTGKTTLAKMLVRLIDCDYIIINASDENNVETVRTKVKNFVSTIGFKNYKIVILDEFDYMTPNAQAILRNLMETFSQYCRFILTCNYKEKIIDPIVSRCQHFEITPPSKKDVAVLASRILNAEGVQFDAKDVVTIVHSGYPDIRRVIQTIQQQTRKGVLKLDERSILDSDFKMKVLELLINGKGAKSTFKQIRQVVADDHVRDFSDMFRLLYDKVGDYASGKETTCIMILADYQHKDVMVVDKEINFAACMIQILGEIK